MRRFAPILAAAVLAGCASAPAEHAAQGAKPVAKDRNAAWAASRARAPLAVTVAFDRRGRLWRAEVQEGRIWLGRVDDLASPRLAVNATPEAIAADGENRPKLAFGRDGEIYVSWTVSGSAPFTGDVRFARSLDGGAHFDSPITVNDDRAAVSHRFDSLVVDGGGRIHLLWLDQREAQARKLAGGAYAGISLYTAVSANRGASFGANRKLADHSCECCRIATALDPDGTPVALWRGVFGKNERDHALLRLDGRSTARRASFDRWAVEACPHHGPALAIGDDGIWHLAWWTGGDNGGLFYARSRDCGASFSAPQPIGARAAQAGRAALYAHDRLVWRAWKEFDGTSTLLRVQESPDGGAHFGTARTVSQSTSASDHPQLAGFHDDVRLSWYSAAEGHRVFALGGAP